MLEGLHYYTQCTPQSDGTLSCGSTTTVTSAQNGYVAIAVRNDGIPFVATRATFISNKDYLYLYKANNHLGTSWSQAGSSEVLQDSGLTRVSMTNMSDNRIMIVSGRDNVRSRIFYKSNSSFGSIWTIETNSGNIAGKVLADKSGVAHVIYRLGGTSNIKYANYTNGPSWSTPRLISSNGATNFAVGITLGPEKQSYVLFHYQTNKIVWNMTNSVGSLVASGVQDVTGNAVSDWLTTSNYSNYTGYFGQLWVSNSNVVFHSFQITGWGSDITVMNSNYFEWETHIAVSPISNTLVSVAIKTPPSSSNHRCATMRSTNGGDSWGNNATIALYNNATGRRAVDPAIAVNSTGHWNVVCLELGNSFDEDIIYTKSSDGITWSAPTPIKSDSSITIKLDKPWIAIDNNVTSPFKDNVYVCWTENQTSYSQIYFQKIGNSSSRQVLYNASKIYGIQMSCNMAIGTNGEVYVVWFDLESNGQWDGAIRMRYNTNGGLDSGWKNMTSTPPSFKRLLRYDCIKHLSETIRKWDCLPGTSPTYFRATAMPGIAVDMKGGVHIVYAENVTSGSDKHGDIKYINSDNCRKNSASCMFSNPITINRDTANKDQFMPTIHVSNITSTSNPRGTIYVTALDRRDDSSNINWKVWSYICAPGSSLGCTSASDWSNIVVNDRAINNHNNLFIGDYYGITHTKTREAYPLWLDDSPYDVGNDNFDVKGDWSKR